MKKHLLILPLALLVGATANAEYSDKHLTSSMRLIMLEKAYDAGVGTGFKEGQELTAAQVADIQKTVRRSEHVITAVDNRLEQINRTDIAVAESANRVLDSANKVLKSADGVMTNADRVAMTHIKTAEQHAGLTLTAGDMVATSKDFRAAADRAHELIASAETASSSVRASADEHAKAITKNAELSVASNDLWNTAQELKVAVNTTGMTAEEMRSTISALRSESEQMKKAQTIIADARDQAGQHMQIAQAESSRIQSEASKRAAKVIAQAESEAMARRTQHKTVMNTPVDCHMRDASFETIMKCLTPNKWELDPQISNKEVLNARWGINTNKPRKQAIFDFLSDISRITKSRIGVQVNLKAHFYPDRNVDGKNKPLLLIAQIKE